MRNAGQLSGIIALIGLLTGHVAVANGGKNDPQEIENFGNNPGNLRMFIREPASKGSPTDKRPMVLVLHGCGQSAKDIMRLAGWDQIADRAGCYLLFAQQKTTNNPMRCFNWYREADTQPLRGEVTSMALMTRYALEHFPIDPARMSVYGVSAGGAMSSALMACYPHLFQNAAIVAGVPYGGVVKEDAERRPILHPNALTPEQWAERVRAVAREPVEHYPRLVVMHGTRDPVSDFELGRALVAQWTAVAGTDSVPDLVQDPFNGVTGVRRSEYRDERDSVVVVFYRFENLGHRLALDRGDGPDEGGGKGWAGKDVGINSTLAIAREFGLVE